MFQLASTSAWVPTFPCRFLSSHTLAHTVWRLFAFDERHEEPGAMQFTREKVPRDSAVHQSPSDGDRRCHCRQQVTERVALIWMHTQWYLMHIPHLLRPTEHVSSGITHTICRMAMQEKNPWQPHMQGLEILSEKEISLPFFRFNFLKDAIL